MVRKIVAVELASTVRAPVIVTVVSGQSKVRSANSQKSFGVLVQGEVGTPEKDIRMFSHPSLLTSLVTLSCYKGCVLAVDGLAVVFVNKEVMGALELPSFREGTHLGNLGLVLFRQLGVVNNRQSGDGRIQCIPWIDPHIHAGKKKHSKGWVASDTRFHGRKSQKLEETNWIRPLTAIFQEKWHGPKVIYAIWQNGQAQKQNTSLKENNKIQK